MVRSESRRIPTPRSIRIDATIVESPAGPTQRSVGSDFVSALPIELEASQRLSSQSSRSTGTETPQRPRVFYRVRGPRTAVGKRLRCAANGFDLNPPESVSKALPPAVHSFPSLASALRGCVCALPQQIGQHPGEGAPKPRALRFRQSVAGLLMRS